MRPWRKRASRVACMRITRVLQSYLDGTLGDIPARRVAEHLEDCRRCGLGASVYTEIKAALGRQDRIDPHTLERLRSFGEQLSAGEQPRA
jgi:hypothetical protein